ncbi:cupin domain-containing protein [Barnesiella viscericola]|uniref:cupin domain-containing protein n=1 Tax=Barnesiella viscericola TaxID=397865 RepID=UPI0023534BBE|nr:cupin domain-containing protein [Barnesiella viscericola]
METIRKIDAGEKFTHATVGDLSAFTGKQFVKDCIGTTGCEISFGTLNPGEAVPFFHSHKENEEVYIVLRGSGDFQVDDTAFPIAEGSIVRVATHCNRSLRCTSATSMLYLCIQTREGSLEECTMGDAEITEQATAWK